MADDFEQYFEKPDEDFEQFFEKPQSEYRQKLDAAVDKAREDNPVSPHEAVIRGANNLSVLGPWSDEIVAGLGAGAYGVAKGVRNLLPGGAPADAPDVSEVYDRLRAEYARREKESFDEYPDAYRLGEGGSFVAQGGAKALASLPGLVASAPAAGRALLTKAGLAAAGLGAAKAGGAGAALGAFSGAGAAEPGHRLEGAVGGAVPGALVGGALGAYTGAAGAGLADAAQRTARAAGAAQTLEQADEATAAARALNETNDVNYQNAQAAHAEEKARHAAEIERLKQQHAADVAQAGSERAAIQDTASAGHAAEIERLKQQHAADVAEAASARSGIQGEAEARYAQELAAAQKAQDEARVAAEAAARAPTKDKAVRLFGLEGMKDQERARRSAESLFDEGGGELRDKVLGLEPAKGLELVRGLKRQAGAELGGVRDELAKRGARVNIGPVLGELRESIGALPSGLKEAAANTVDDIVLQGAQMGEMDAGRLRQAIENLDGPSKFGATLANGTPARETAPVFRRARAALLDIEKQLVAEQMPERLEGYNDASRRYSLLSDAELGAKTKFGRENRGQEIINFPKPEKPPEVPMPEKPAGPYNAKVAAPILPEEPAGPYNAKVAGPVLPPEPAAPRRERVVPVPDRPENEAELRAAVDAAAPVGRTVARNLAGAGVRAIGGGQLGASMARRAVDGWFQQIAPNAAQLRGQAEALQERLADLAPVFARAQAQGPQAVAVTHRLLMQSSPDYAAAIQVLAGGDESPSAR